MYKLYWCILLPEKDRFLLYTGYADWQEVDINAVHLAFFGLQIPFVDLEFHGSTSIWSASPGFTNIIHALFPVQVLQEAHLNQNLQQYC